MSVARRISGASAVALSVEAVLICPCGFAPGWANGWPGVSKHTAFAATVSLALFLAIVAAGAAVLAVPCSLLQGLIKRAYVGWGVFASLMLAWAAVAAFIGAGAYPAVRAGIAKEWP